MHNDYRLKITLALSPGLLKLGHRALDVIVNVGRIDKLSADLASEESKLKVAVAANPLPPV